MGRKRKDKEKPDVNPELDDFSLEINEFGEIKSNYDIDKINKFLNDNVDDKKLRDAGEKDTGNEEKKADKKKGDDQSKKK